MSLPLTVAIPTMRRWEPFLKMFLPTYLNSPQVRHVLISDETGEDIAAILASEWALHPKLILNQNPVRLGIYHNKRRCIELAPTEWVGVFDSDNFFPPEYFQKLEEIWNKGFNPMHFYACGRGFFVNENGGDVTRPLDLFSGHVLDRSNWNSIFNLQGWNYLLNDGNWVVNRSVLAHLPTDVLDKDILAADAIYMVHKFVRAGYSFNIVDGLSYIHTVHKGSTWAATSEDSTRIFNDTNWTIEPHSTSSSP